MKAGIRVLWVVLALTLWAGRVDAAIADERPGSDVEWIRQAPTVDARSKALGASFEIEGIPVFEFSGDYSRGSSPSRAQVAQRYFERYRDDRDLLLVFTDFEFETGQASAFANIIKNDVQGIGLAPHDNSAAFGSVSGRLHNYIDMAAVSRWELNPSSPGYGFLLDVATHEVMHRWVAFPKYLKNGVPSSDLIGQQQAHWSFFLDSDASVMYGSDWQLGADGQFEAVDVRHRLSPLDLYLAGLFAAAEVPDMTLIRGGAGATAEDLPVLGFKTPGSAETISIGQIIAANGERQPDVSRSPKHFSAGLLLLVRPGQTITEETIFGLQRFARDFETRFAAMTRGRGSLSIQNQPIRLVETGTPAPISGQALCTTCSLDIAQAKVWLLAQQRTSDGAFVDKQVNALATGATALRAMVSGNFGTTAATAPIRAWLSAFPARHFDDLAFKARVGVAPSTAAELELAGARDQQLNAGLPGLAPAWSASAWDAAAGMVSAGFVDLGASERGAFLNRLRSLQNADGGFGIHPGGVSHVGLTAWVLNEVAPLADPAAVEIASSSAAWLLLQQSAEGGFGSGADGVLPTAWAVAGLVRLGNGTDVGSAMSYLRSRQSLAGDWNGSVFTTAEVIRVLAEIAKPNLSFDGSIVATPAAPISGDRVHLVGRVRNDGVLAQGVKIAWFLGDPDQGGVAIGTEADLGTLSAGQSLEVSADWDSTGFSGSQSIVAVLDRADSIDELNESDNRQIVALDVAGLPQAPDAALLRDNFVLTPSSVNVFPAAVALAGQVVNLGGADLVAVPVVLYQVRNGVRSELARAVLDVPAQSAVPLRLEFTLQREDSRSLLLVADPDNAIPEIRENNNQLAFELASVAGIDLAIAGSDLVQLTQPAVIHQPVRFRVSAHNNGASASPAFTLAAVVEQGGQPQPLGDILVQIEAGGSIERELSWTPSTTGPASLSITLDEAAVVEDADRSNNSAMLDFAVVDADAPNLTVPVGSLALSPLPLDQARTATMQFLVRNAGAALGSDFVVAISSSGSTGPREELARTTMGGGLSAGAEVPVSLALPALPAAGDRLFFVTVDPDALIVELNEDDNIAFVREHVRSLPDASVSIASLRLTPSVPIPGQSVRADVSIRNLGEQPLEELVARLFDGTSTAGSPIGADQTAPTIPGGASADVAWTWIFAGNAGEATLSVVLDPDAQIAEAREDNNLAVVPLQGQADQFATEPYISPNDDGIKESTQVLFGNLPAAPAIIEVLDQAGRSVRSYPPEQFVGNNSYAVLWEGRADDGSLVADGPYRVRALAADGALLGDVTVVVDTNRSPILAAVGTRMARFSALHTDPLQVLDPPAGYHDQDTVVLRDPLNLATARVDDRLPGLYRFDRLLGTLEPVLDAGWLLPRGPDASVVAAHWVEGGEYLVAVVRANAQDSIWRVDVDGRNLAQRWAAPEAMFDHNFVDNRMVVNVDIRSNHNKTVVVWGRQAGALSARQFRLTDGAATVVSMDALAGQSLYLRGMFDDGLLVGSASGVGRPFSGLHFVPLDPGSPIHTIQDSDVDNEVLHLGDRGALVHYRTGNQEIVEWRSLRDAQSRRIGEELLTAENIQNQRCTLLAERSNWTGGELLIQFMREGRLALVDVETGNSRSFNLPTVPRIGSYRTQQFINIGDELLFEGTLSRVERSADCSGSPLFANPDGTNAVNAKRRQVPSAKQLFEGNQPNRREPGTSLIFDGEVVVVVEETIPQTFHVDGTKSAFLFDRRSGQVTRLGGYTNWPLLDPANGAQFPALPLRQSGFVPPNSPPGVPAGADPDALPRELIFEYHARTAIEDPWLSLSDGSGISYPNDPNGELDLADLDVFLSNGYLNGAQWPKAFKLSSGSPSATYLTAPVWRYYASLANQVSKLRARGSTQGIDLLGIAEDQNFLQFELEWANPAAPEQWHAIGPAVLESATDGELMSWTPPAAGQYLLRLSTLDKAGNRRQASARAVSPAGADIANPRLASRFISPNGDGVKDRLEIAFDVLRPTNLHIEIRNAAGLLITSEDLQATSPGPFEWNWDGHQATGALAADGGYRITVNTWFATGFTVDATPPTAALQRVPATSRALPNKLARVQNDRVDLGLAWQTADVNLDAVALESGEGPTPARWMPVDANLPVLGTRLLRREDADNYRVIAVDRAGNRSSSDAAGVPPPDLALVGRWVGLQNDPARPWGCDDQEQGDGCIYRQGQRGARFGGGDPFSIESAAVIDLDLYVAPGTPDANIGLRFRIDRFGSDAILNGPWQTLPVTLQRRSGVELRLAAVAPTLPMDSLITVEAITQLDSGENLESDRALFGYFGLGPPVPCRPDQFVIIPGCIHVQESLFGMVVAPTLSELRDDGSVLVLQPIRIEDGVVTFQLPDLGRGCKELTARAQSQTGGHFESHGDCPPPNFLAAVEPVFEPSCDALPQHKMRYGVTIALIEVAHLFIDFALPDGHRRVVLDQDNPQELGLFVGLQGEFDASDLPDGRYELTFTVTAVDGEQIQTISPFSVDHSPTVVDLRRPQEGSRQCVFPDPSGTVVLPFDATIDELSGGVWSLDIGDGPSGMIVNPPKAPKTICIALKKPRPGTLCFNTASHFVSLRPISARFAPRATLRGRLSGPSQIRLNTFNWGGAPQCKLVNFFADDRVEASLGYLPGSVAADIAGVAILNPAGAAEFRTIGVELRAEEPLRARFELWRGASLATAVRVGELRAEAAYTQGTHSLSWDGKLADGQRVADGRYWIRVFATDDCGHESGDARAMTVPVLVDSTGPSVVFYTPATGAVISNLLVRIEGRATDPSGGVFELSAQSAETISIQSGELLLPIAQAGDPRLDFAQSWNRGEISGPVLLRVVAIDKVGNRTTTELPIELAPRPFRFFDGAQVVPELISPNGDGAFDRSEIRYALAANADVSARVFTSAGALLTVLQNGEPMLAGNHSLSWNGQGLPEVAADGAYVVELHAVNAQDTNQFEDLSLPLTVDIAPPQLSVATPTGRYSKGSGPLEINIGEPHFGTASALFAGQTVALTEAGLSAVLALDDIAEGAHNLMLTARDSVANAASLEREIVIDRTPPEASIDTPAESAVLGGAASEAIVQGSASDANFERYRLSIAAAATPAAQTLLVESSTAVSDGALHALSLAPADGDYLLTLTATDLAGHSREARRAIRIDHTPPVAVLTAPADHAFVSRQFEISGTASDTNLNDYRLRLATPEQASLGLWSDLLVATESVSDGSLGRVDLTVPDGEYLLELVASDRVLQHSESRIRIHLDSTPPPAPIDLVGNRQGEADVALAWQHDAPADLLGYRVYRDGARLNPTPVPGRAWLDPAVPSGRLRYEVSALDQAGNESARSNPVLVVVDRTPPVVDLIAPADAAVVSGGIRIRGTAFSEDDFDRYRLSLLEPATRAPIAVLAESSRAVQGGELAVLDTRAHPEGAQLTLLLEAWDRNGNRAEDRVTVSVDNIAPAAPTGLTAIDSNGDGQIDWNANSEPDLLGYVLLRDGVPVNGGSIFPDDLRLLAITPNTWLDRSLVDGEHVWIVFAIDRAGNLSPPSDPANLTISRRPPDIAIASPLAGHRFEGSLPVLAVSQDTDIAEVRFSVRALGAATWTAIGADASLPYETVWTPGALPFGDYELRAEATDQSGQDDPTPAVIVVSYADLTPPAQVIGLAAHAEGGDVLLSWTAVVADDLAHYRVERRQGELYSFVNVAEVPAGTTSLVDSVPEDREWQYQVTAVDTNGNAGEASGIALARVFSIKLDPPFSPIQQATTALHGQSPVAGQLQLARATNGAPLELLTQPVGSDAFDLTAVPLLAGENHLLLTVTDAEQNVSRVADAWVSTGAPPSAPTGLAVAVSDHQVTATWNANPEPDVIGYRLFRRDSAALVERDLDDLTASAAQPLDAPWAAIDGDPATAWAARSYFYGGPLEDVWLELSTAEPRQISALSLSWLNGRKPAAFDVLAYSGRAWVRIASVAAVQDAQTIRLEAPYRTRQIRIVPTAAAVSAGDDYQQSIALAEVVVSEQALIAATEFVDTLIDGSYPHQVSAVNALGFEGLRSDPVTAEVGDAEAPGPVLLSGTVQGRDAQLDWTASGSPDVARYRLLRDGIERAVIDAPRSDFVDANLANGSYTYTVIALDAFDNASPPSNAVLLTINVAGPGVPRDLRVLPVPAGGALDVDWQPGAGAPSVRYLLRRSEAESGPFVEIAETTALVRHDQPLVNGTRYWYTVEAFDSAGNASGQTAPVAGVPQDQQAPLPPLLTFPVRDGESLTLDVANTTVAGFAEPDAQVSIRRNGGEVFSTRSQVGDLLADVNGYTEGRLRASPSGVWLFSDGSIEIHTVEDTGLTIDPYRFGRLLSWTRDDRLLHNNNGAWLSTSPSGGDDRVLNIPLETVEDARFSSDLRYVIARAVHPHNGSPLRALWLVDQLAGSVRPVPGVDPDALVFDDLVISEGSGFAAWRALDGEVRLLTLATAQSRLVASDTQAVRLALSPRSGELLLVRSAGGQSQVERVDRDGQSTPVGPGLIAAWSPDADRYVVAESGGVLAFHSERDDALLRRLDLQANEISDLDWTASGRILVDTSSGTRRIDPESSFRSAPIALVAGENRLDLLAVDAAGLSQASNPPGVVIRPGTGPALPDLSLNANDIHFLPAGGVPGQNYAVQLVVRNIGAAASAATLIRATLVRPDGSQSQLPNPPTVPALGIGASAGLGLSLGQLDQTGSYWLRAELLVDRPDANLSNHVASQRLLLSASPAPVLELGADASNFAPGVDASGRVGVRNNGSAFSGSVRLRIRTQSGELISTLPTLAVNALAFGGEVAQAWRWPTAGVLAGGYLVEADLLDQQDRQLGSRQVEFAVAAVRDLRLDVASERAAYAVGETVRLSASLDYRSGNAIIAAAALRLGLLDAAGDEVFTTTRNLATLLPGVRLQIPASWTASGTVGIYTVRAELLEAGVVTRQAQGSFRLDAANGVAPVTGSIEPAPAPLIAGRPGQIDYLLHNAAGSVLAVDLLRLRLLRAPGLEEVAMASVSGPAPALGQLPGRLELDPDRLPIGDYLAVLDWRASAGGAPVTLATRSVSVIDGIAPLIVLQTPAAGAWVRGAAALAAQVSDVHSGVDRVEIAIDGGSWRIAPLQPQGGYGLDAGGLADGLHRFQVRARDRAGNESISAVRDFQVDNTPPRILIGGVADGDLVNHPVTPVVSIDEAHPGETSIALGANAFVSGSVVSADGSYLLSVVAHDLAGNVATASVRFQIDTTAPLLSFITPLDGDQTTLASVEARLQSEPESSVRLGVGGFEQTVLADAAGIATFASVPLVFGSNALQASATDQAGNQGAPVGVQVDRIDNSGAALVGSLVPTAAAFASATPAVLNWQVVNPLTTPLPGQTLRIRVVHVSSAQLLGEDTVAVDIPDSGQATGSSQFGTVGAPLGRYTATLAVRVATDWIQLATAEFDLIDLEPPMLALLAPTEAALVNDLVQIRASASDRLGSIGAVRYRLDGASWIGMSVVAGAPDIYQSAPLDLPDADYQVEADATDNVGNAAATPIRHFTVDRTAPLIEVGNVADGGAYNQAVTPLIQITELHPASQSITLDGQPFVSGTPVHGDGNHLLLIDATDAAGNHSARSIGFLIDTTPPVIAFTFPAEDAVVATPVLDVGGLSEAQARIEFRTGASNSTVFADELGGFVVPGVALALGSNLLEARAIDALGNASAWIGRSIDYVPNAGAMLDAALTVSTVDLPLGQVLSAGYTLTNTGNIGIQALPMRLLWLRLADQQQLSAHPFTLDLAPTAVFSDSVDLPSQDTLPGAHLVVLEGLLTAANGSQNWQTLASEQVIVRDVLPPVVAVLLPAAGSFVDTGFLLRVAASDLHSSVATVQGLVDSSPIAMVPDAVAGEYIATVTASSEGPLNLSARAVDSAGNPAEAASRQVIVDLFPPVIAVSGIDPDALTNQPVSLQIQITDVSPVQTSITLDGQPFVSGGTVGSDGAHLLRALATDALDRTSERLLGFTIDRTPPLVRIDLPGDGAIIFADSTRVVGSTEPLAEVSLQVGAFNALLSADAAGIFSVDNVPLQPGLNQIAARATDRAGNVGPEVSIQVERRAQPVVALHGQIVIAESKWSNGVPLDAAFVLDNIGTAELATLPVRLEARRRDTQQLLQSADFRIDLHPGAQHTESFVWSTSDWGLGEVEISLSADLPVLRALSILDRHVLLMQDREPPTVAFEAPIDNAQVHAGDPVRVLASDRLSAIASVELRVDAGAWQTLPAIDVLAGRYGSPLPVLTLGPHRLAARGLDAAGNTAVTADLPIQVVGVLPLLVTAPIDGSSTTALDADFAGSTSPGATVNLHRGSDHWQTTADPGGAFLLAAVPLAAGVNEFTVQAADGFGNTSAIVPVAVTATALAEPIPVPSIGWRGLIVLTLLMLLYSRRYWQGINRGAGA